MLAPLHLAALSGYEEAVETLLSMTVKSVLIWDQKGILQSFI